MASDFFLKFDHDHKFFDHDHKFGSFDEAAEQAARDLRRLGDNFVDLGDGFLKFIHDGTSEVPSTAAVSVDLKFKLDDAILSHDFLKLGGGFLETSAAEHKVDIKEIQVIKVIDKASPLLFASVGDGGGGALTVGTDLLKYDADLKITGIDTLKIAPAIGADAPTESLSLNFSKISVDYKQQGADELKIADDFITLAKQTADLKIRGLSDAFLKYGEDALKLGNDYLKLGTDFQKISDDFLPQPQPDAAAAGGEIKFNQGVLQNSADFIKLAGDLKLMNTDFSAIGGDTLKLSETLETAAHQLLPAVQKG